MKYIRDHGGTDYYVASLAEAWIEIRKHMKSACRYGSPPSRRRGLKYACRVPSSVALVASLAEAWIEIDNGAEKNICFFGRLPRGGVD